MSTTRGREDQQSRCHECKKPAHILNITPDLRHCTLRHLPVVDLGWSAVDRGTQVFWAIIVALFGASAYFGLGVRARQGTIQTPEASLESGELVRLERVIDGDTVVVKTSGGAKVVVRIVGIKSFESTPAKDPSARFGAQAVGAIQQLAAGAPIRVLPSSPPKDRHGRTLATLIVGEQDLGLALVKRGLSLVYPVYPFPALSLYLEGQEAARSAELGLWGEPKVAKKADSLLTEWRNRSE